MKEDVVRAIEVPMEEVAKLAATVFSAGGTLPLTVKGGSMMPFLRPLKDCVILSTASFMGLHRGDVVLARRTDGSYVLHRVWKNSPDEFWLLGDAQVKPEGPFLADDLIARVNTWFRFGKKYRADAKLHRLFVNLWMCLRFQRPIILWMATRVVHVLRLTRK